MSSEPTNDDDNLDWPADLKQLVDIKFVKAKLNIRSHNSIKKLITKGILEAPIPWGLRGLRWRAEQVLEALYKMRAGQGGN